MSRRWPTSVFVWSKPLSAAALSRCGATTWQHSPNTRFQHSDICWRRVTGVSSALRRPLRWSPRSEQQPAPETTNALHQEEFNNATDGIRRYWQEKQGDRSSLARSFHTGGPATNHSGGTGNRRAVYPWSWPG